MTERGGDPSVSVMRPTCRPLHYSEAAAMHRKVLLQNMNEKTHDKLTYCTITCTCCTLDVFCEQTGFASTRGLVAITSA